MSKQILRLIFFITFFVVVISSISFIFSWFSDAGETAKKEFSVSAQLKKYEWFKDASAQLDKKLADVKVYEQRMENLEEDYKEISRNKWPREDREQYNIWSSEVAGVKSSYNQLASEYNSNMSKVNFAFANRGDLPSGATEPLPREYKPYIEK